jgi:hypothetical protein
MVWRRFRDNSCGGLGNDPKYTWKIIGIYRAPNEEMRLVEMLAARTGFLGNSTKRSIIGGDLNLPQVDWEGAAGGTSLTQAFINRLVWYNGYTQVVRKPTKGGFFTGRLPRSTRKCTHILRYGARHQWPLRGVIKRGMGENRVCNSEERTITCGAQNKCVMATRVSSG